MLVSNAKQCKSKHRPPQGQAANDSVYWPQFIRPYAAIWITGNSIANTCNECLDLTIKQEERVYEIKASRPTSRPASRPSQLVTQDNFGLIACPAASDKSFECTPYQAHM